MDGEGYSTLCSKIRLLYAYSKFPRWMQTDKIKPSCLSWPQYSYKFRIPIPTRSPHCPFFLPSHPHPCESFEVTSGKPQTNNKGKGRLFLFKKRIRIVAMWLCVPLALTLALSQVSMPASLLSPLIDKGGQRTRTWSSLAEIGLKKERLKGIHFIRSIEPFDNFEKSRSVVHSWGFTRKNAYKFRHP